MLSCLWPTASGVVQLPVEVFTTSQAAHVEDLRIPVSTSAPGRSLALRFHNLSYSGKASLRIENGVWLSLRNGGPGFTVRQPGRQYGGIGGAFHSLWIDCPLPAAATADGFLDISLRVNGTDGTSMGFRLIDCDVLAADGASLLPPGTVVQDEPRQWRPPSSAQTDIEAGEHLWRHGRLQASPLSARILAASCADCHTQDGRDLQFFGYSNLSIIQRSRFHGLTRRQGEQIASYIRSLPVRPAADPWDPLFQPGPGLGNKPVDEWSAGAGLEAVLARDEDAWNHLPGAGIDRDAMLDGDRFRDLPQHEIPVAMQLLDWNRWLPEHHPADILGEQFFHQHDYYTRYQAIRQHLSDASGRADYLAEPTGGPGSLQRDLELWGELVPRNSDDGLGKILYDRWQNGQLDDLTYVRQRYSLALWSAAKSWELLHEFSLHGIGRQWYGGDAPDRFWPSNRHLFNISPHRLRILDLKPALGDPEADGAMINRYLANAWYEIQMQVNDGAREATTGGFHTVDWGYTFGLFKGLAQTSGGSEPGRAVRTVWHAMQTHDNNLGPEGYGAYGNEGSWYGWDLRDNTLDPLNLHQPSVRFPGIDSKAVFQTLAQAWVEKNASFTRAQWAQATSFAGRNVEDDSYVWGTAASKARSFAEILPKWIDRLRQDHDTHEAVLAGMADFGNMLYPRNDWQGLKRGGSALAAPTNLRAVPRPGAIQLSWQAVPGAQSYIIQRTTNPQRHWQSIRIFHGGTSYLDRRVGMATNWHYRVLAANLDDYGRASSVVRSSPSKGLVAHWPLDAGGSLLGATGQQLSLGGVQTSAGLIGDALHFDGQDDRLWLQQSLHRWLQHSSSLSLWFKTTATGHNQHNKSMILLGGASNQQRWVLHIDAAGHLRAELVGGGRSAILVSDQALNDGRWHHLLVSRDTSSGLAVLYVDGSEHARAQAPQGLLTERIHHLGRGAFDQRRSFAGSMDELRIYNHPLSAQAVGELYRVRQRLPSDNRRPQADAGSDRVLSGSGPTRLRLDGSASRDDDGHIAAWTWWYGNKVLSTGVRPSITLAPGQHTLRLEVRDDDGAAASDRVTVRIVNQQRGWRRIRIYRRDAPFATVGIEPFVDPSLDDDDQVLFESLDPARDYLLFFSPSSAISN